MSLCSHTIEDLQSAQSTRTTESSFLILFRFRQHTYTFPTVGSCRSHPCPIVLLWRSCYISRQSIRRRWCCQAKCWRHKVVAGSRCARVCSLLYLDRILLSSYAYPAYKHSGSPQRRIGRKPREGIKCNRIRHQRTLPILHPLLWMQRNAAVLRVIQAHTTKKWMLWDVFCIFTEVRSYLTIL